MRLEGEVDRLEYLSRKAEMSAVMAFRETPLGAGWYDAEVALGRVPDVGQVIREGEQAQQRPARRGQRRDWRGRESRAWAMVPGVLAGLGGYMGR